MVAAFLSYSRVCTLSCRIVADLTVKLDALGLAHHEQHQPSKDGALRHAHVRQEIERVDIFVAFLTVRALDSDGNEVESQVANETKVAIATGRKMLLLVLEQRVEETEFFREVVSKCPFLSYIGREISTLVDDVLHRMSKRLGREHPQPELREWAARYEIAQWLEHYGKVGILIDDRHDESTRLARRLYGTPRLPHWWRRKIDHAQKAVEELSALLGALSMLSSRQLDEHDPRVVLVVDRYLPPKPGQRASPLDGTNRDIDDDSRRLLEQLNRLIRELLERPGCTFRFISSHPEGWFPKETQGRDESRDLEWKTRSLDAMRTLRQEIRRAHTGDGPPKLLCYGPSSLDGRSIYEQQMGDIVRRYLDDDDRHPEKCLLWMGEGVHFLELDDESDLSWPTAHGRQPGPIGTLDDTLYRAADRLADVLADVVYDADRAREIARGAGHRGRHLPPFANAEIFWRTVVHQVPDGKALLGGLVRRAAQEFPDNAELEELVKTIEACAPPERGKGRVLHEGRGAQGRHATMRSRGLVDWKLLEGELDGKKQSLSFLDWLDGAFDFWAGRGDLMEFTPATLAALEWHTVVNTSTSPDFRRALRLHAALRAGDPLLPAKNDGRASSWRRGHVEGHYFAPLEDILAKGESFLADDVDDRGSSSPAKVLLERFQEYCEQFDVQLKNQLKPYWNVIVIGEAVNAPYLRSLHEVLANHPRRTCLFWVSPKPLSDPNDTSPSRLGGRNGCHVQADPLSFAYDLLLHVRHAKKARLEAAKQSP